MMRGDHTHIKDTPLAHPEFPAMPINRPALHQTLFDYAIEVGVPIEQGRTVSTYFEDEHQAGVVYDDGTREVADVVVAAEAKEKGEDRAFDESQNGVVAQLLEEVPPQSCTWIVLGYLLIFPSIVVELQNYE